MALELEKNLIKRVAVGDIIRRNAARLPDKEAVIEERDNRKTRYTYKELNSQANCFAWAMRGLGLKKGDRVATICGNSTELVVVIFGLAKAGMVWVPVNPGLSIKDIAYIVRHSEAKAVIADNVLCPAVKQIDTEIPELKHYFYIPVTDDPVPGLFQDFYQLMASGFPKEMDDVIIEDRDLVQIMYTSGTTAAPKGVMLSHLSVFIVSLCNIIEMEFFRDSVVSALMPLFHAAEHAFMMSTLHAGAKLVVMRGFDAVKLLANVQREKMTRIFCLPMMYRALLDHPDIDKYDLSSLRHCTYAMTPMDRRTLEEAIDKFGARFCLPTGQTEAYPSSNNFKPEWQLIKKGNYWGESAMVFDTAVLDEEGNMLPPGQVGEIAWRSPAIMEGYYKDPKATEDSWRSGWHRSQDLGCFDEDGLLVFMDRKKDMIKSGGENVPSIKVERVILADPRVESAAVIGLPHPQWIEAITAFVVPRAGSKVTGEDIIQHCKKELGRFEVPKAVIFVDSLPRTTTGKLQKHIVRNQYQDFYNK